MALDVQTVEKIAQLAQLKIDAKDISQYAENLSKTLDLLQQLADVDTSNIEPLTNPLDAVQRLRTDEVTESTQRTLLQSQAPQVAEGLFQVPKVID